MATKKKKSAAKKTATKRPASVSKARAKSPAAVARRSAVVTGGPSRPAPTKPRPADPKAERFERILGVFNDSGLAELEYEDEELAIKVARYPSGTAAAPTAAPAPVVAPAAPAAAAPAAPAGPAPEPTGQVVSSPFVGTFYRSPSPEAPAFADVGQRVSKGQTLCIIEAMKLMNEIPSELDGVVTKVLVSNGDVVQYGDGLFEIGPG